MFRGYHGDKPFPEHELRAFDWTRAERLGLALPPSLVALDPDVRDRVNGAEQLRRMAEMLGAMPESELHQRTPCGAHVIFRLPDEVAEQVVRNRVRFNPQVRLPSGEDSAIDIICHRHRFLVLYSSDFPQVAPDARIPAIPHEWLPYMLGSRSRRRQRTRASRPSPRGSDERLEQLRSAPVGERNNTLNLVVLRLVVEGRWNRSVEERVESAALDCGLSPREVGGTIDSAKRAGLREWKPALDGLGHVKSLPLGEDLLLSDDLLLWDTTVAIATKAVESGAMAEGSGVVGRGLTQDLGHAESRSCAGESEMIRDHGPQELLR